jgi:uncharacterized protein YndB with AHSA1/START domain
MTNETKIEKHPSGTKLIVTRTFNAPVAKVWRAWTEKELLDQWWAPKPWKTETKELNFTEGGHWLYAMAGPDGEKHWCRFDYKTIETQKNYSGADAFCDENGVPNSDFPSMNWFNQFIDANNTTDVTVEITFDSAESLEKIVEMGFKEGFTMAHSNLDELLA